MRASVFSGTRELLSVLILKDGIVVGFGSHDSSAARGQSLERPRANRKDFAVQETSNAETEIREITRVVIPATYTVPVAPNGCVFSLKYRVVQQRFSAQWSDSPERKTIQLASLDSLLVIASGWAVAPLAIHFSRCYK